MNRKSACGLLLGPSLQMMKLMEAKNLMVVMMIDEDKFQAHHKAPGLQPRKALAAMLSKATRILGKRPTEIMLKQLLGTSNPCLLSHVLVPRG